ncbi:MAG: ACP S-malonyltransferase [Duodenibacillus sp.]|nr:ACP S-malonyltransferase [Duodenibacillus sp.]
MKLAFVFPGQGSQSVGMMDGWVGNEAAEQVLEEAGRSLKEDLASLMHKGPTEILNLTVNTQPVMLASSLAMYRAYRAAGGRAPDVMAGHSLGEYTALTAAGAFSLFDAVRLVRFRAEAMQSAVPVGVGSMAAIIGGKDDVLAEVCKQAAQGEVVEMVNFNAPGQIVIAGHRNAVERACALAVAKGARRAVKLPVSAPFHSSLLIDAARAIAVRLAQTAVNIPQIPVIANVDVLVHDTPESIRDSLARQASRPVQWVKTIEKMRDMGVTHIVECGPGKVLTGLIRRIAPEIQTMSINSQASLDSILATESFRE